MQKRHRSLRRSTNARRLCSINREQDMHQEHRAWTANESALLVELWTANVRRDIIAERLNRTQKSVYGKVKRLRSEGRIVPSGRQADRWPPARTEALKGLFGRNLSCREMACRLGISRDAVIGKLYRLGLSVPTQELIRRRHAAAKRTHEKISRTKPNFVFGRRQRPASVGPLFVTPDPEPHERVIFTDRQPRQCSWVCDDKNNVCGRPVHATSSWCPDHFIRVFLIPKGRCAA